MTPITKPTSVKEAIETRHSIRQFVNEPIPQDDLHEILRQASLAPSAWNVQTWRFAVIQNPELQRKLQEASFNQPQVTSAPAVIVMYSDMEEILNNPEAIAHPALGEAGQTKMRDTLTQVFGAQSVEARGQWGLAQANIGFGFLMLAAQGMGYDTVPMLGFEPQKVRELLNLPEHVQFAGLLPIGRRAEEGKPHHRFDLDHLVTFYS